MSFLKAVKRIIDDGIAKVLKVDANLVSPSSDWIAFQKGCVIFAIDRNWNETSGSAFPTRINTTHDLTSWVRPNGFVALKGFHARQQTLNSGEVLFLDLVASDQTSHLGGSLKRRRDHQEPRCHPVDSVHDYFHT